MPCTPAATRATVKSFRSGISAPAYEQEQRVRMILPPCGIVAKQKS